MAYGMERLMDTAGRRPKSLSCEVDLHVVWGRQGEYDKEKLLHPGIDYYVSGGQGGGDMFGADGVADEWRPAGLTVSMFADGKFEEPAIECPSLPANLTMHNLLAQDEVYLEYERRVDAYEAARNEWSRRKVLQRMRHLLCSR